MTKKRASSSSAPRLRYFFSGAPGHKRIHAPRISEWTEHRLLSMHPIFKSVSDLWLKIMVEYPKCGVKELMLDSGAFTAFTKGQKMTLDDVTRAYDAVLARLSSRPDIKLWFINLDVIPGAPGRVAEEKEIQEALAESDKNFAILRKRYGDRVLPVYHQTEPHQRLIDLASESDFIGCGFRLDFSEEHRIRHAEDCYRILSRRGKKMHGLASTGYDMLRRVPFDTVDSATWLYVSAMGGVLVMDDRGDLRTIKVSSASPDQKFARRHLLSLSAPEKELVERRLRELGDCSIKQIQDELSFRILVSAWSLTRWLRESYSPPSSLVINEGLFDDHTV